MREILAVGGAVEILALAPRKGRAMTRPIFSLSQSFRAMRQSVIEALKAERLFMRRDLEHRIGGGVADRLQRPQVLLAVVVDDRRARGVAIGENAGKLALGDHRFASAIAGKAGIVCGK